MSLERMKRLVTEEPRHEQMGSDLSSYPPLHSEVIIEFNESARLPIALLKIRDLCELMRKRFGFSLEDRSARILSSGSIDIDQTSAKDFSEMIPFHLVFENGLYSPGPKKEPIRILKTRIDETSCLVSAAGSDEDAETVVGAIYDEVNKQVNFKKTYSKDTVHARSFGTSSISKLDLGLDSALSPRLNNALQKTIGSDEAMFKKIGGLRTVERDGPLDRYKLVTKIRSIELQVNRIDMLAGDSESCRLAVSPRTRSDAGYGEYVIISEYDNETHAELVSSLEAALNPNGSDE